MAIDLFHHHLRDLIPVARQALVDNIAEGMLILDEADRILEINQRAQAIIELQPSEAIGRHITDAWKDWRIITESSVQTDAVPFEVNPLQASERWYEVRISPLRDREGHPAGRLVLVLDVTRYKETEERLLRSNLELQTHNAELDTFAHMVAHDLKRPLTVVTGFSELALRRLASIPDIDPLLEECVHTIRRTGRKMASIVNELLLLASVSQQEVVAEPLDIAAIVAAAQESLEPMMTERAAEISQPTTWPAAMGHAQWIEQVWVNLISNAIKYGGDPPHIDLGADQFTHPVTGQSRVHFWVRDNGPGLTTEQRAQLFTAFARMHPDQADGHGLGLFLVRRIIDKLGGQVDVETVLGEGSRFYFDLPAIVTP